MSYDGRLGFGLLGDYDALADLDTLADMLRASIDALADGASVPRRAARGRRATRDRTAKAATAPARGGKDALMAGKALYVVGTIVLTVLLVAGAAAFFVSRDDATVPRATQSGPGEPRPAGAEPTVRPGNVVLLHSDERLTLAAARARRADRRARPDAALEAAGQAVLVQQRPNLDVPVTAVTATRMLEAAGPDDPALEAFVEYWLGRTG